MSVWKKGEERNIACAKRYLRKKFEEAATQGIRGSYHVVKRYLAKSIIKFCRKEEIDLVVMTHGKSGLRGVVLGSVSDEIIQAPGFSVPVILPRRQPKS